MKYLLMLFAVMLVSCKCPFSTSNCPVINWDSDLVFDAEIVVTEGFYKGATGYIVKQHPYYGDNMCLLPGFKVNLYSKNIGWVEDIFMEQSELKKVQ